MNTIIAERALLEQAAEVGAAATESDGETFDRLAKLPLVGYDRCREAEAKRLKIRSATLDAEVARRRPTAADTNAQGRAVNLAVVEPWPEPVDGAAILSEIAVTFGKYVVLPDGAADAIALWCAHAHTFNTFVHSPRLNLCSPDKGCGKTLLLDVIGTLVPRPLRTESITAAVLFRLVDAQSPTLLLDEVDAYLNDAEELRGLLNAGHKRGASAYRCEGDNNDVRGFNAFAPAALAGIGHLPGTLHDRSIVIRLVRAKPGEITARFDSRHVEHEQVLCRKLARWTANNAARLDTSDPVLPDGAFNRLADNWRPLFAIAEVAGGDWPERARRAFEMLVLKDDADAQGIGTMLLGDIKTVFEQCGTDKIFSKSLVESLIAMSERPWGEIRKGKAITENWLAHRLRSFEVTSKTIRIGPDVAKGYHLTDFDDAFARFLSDTPLSKRYSVTTLENNGDSAPSETLQAEGVLRFENATSANKDAGCNAVTFPKTPAPVLNPKPEAAASDTLRF